MEQLYHLIEILVQIVFVKHKYGLGHDKGMVKTAGFENDQSPTRKSYTHVWKWARKGREKHSKVKVEGAPGLVLPQGPAHCPFLISVRPTDMPVPRSLQSLSLCAEKTRGSRA